MLVETMDMDIKNTDHFDPENDFYPECTCSSGLEVFTQCGGNTSQLKIETRNWHQISNIMSL